MGKPIFYKVKLVRVKSPLETAYGIDKAKKMIQAGQTVGVRLATDQNPYNPECICEICGENKWMFLHDNKIGETKPYVECLNCRHITHL